MNGLEFIIFIVMIGLVCFLFGKYLGQGMMLGILELTSSKEVGNDIKELVEDLKLKKRMCKHNFGRKMIILLILVGREIQEIEMKMES